MHDMPSNDAKRMRRHRLSSNTFQPARRRLVDLLRQPSTYAGIFAIAGAVFSGGLSSLVEPAVLSQVATGLALVFVDEPRD